MDFLEILFLHPKDTNPKVFRIVTITRKDNLLHTPEYPRNLMLIYFIGFLGKKIKKETNPFSQARFMFGKMLDMVLLIFKVNEYRNLILFLRKLIWNIYFLETFW